MITNLIYVAATSSLLVGTVMNFDSGDISNYFYLVGTCLFVINSLLKLCESKDKKKRKYSLLVEQATDYT